MKKNVVISLVCLLIIALSGSAFAHSTKGRIKIPLSKKTLEIDDVAYFMESYVHRHFYKGKYEKAEKRFYVNKFLKIDQDRNEAMVYFKTLDNKTKKIFDDKMLLHRQPCGVWVYVGSDEIRPMYTYVKKTGYYYKKYVLPISSGGIFLAVCVLGFLRFRKRKQKSSPAKQEIGQAEAAVENTNS